MKKYLTSIDSHKRSKTDKDKEQISNCASVTSILTVNEKSSSDTTKRERTQLRKHAELMDLLNFTKDTVNTANTLDILNITNNNNLAKNINHNKVSTEKRTNSNEKKVCNENKQAINENSIAEQATPKAVQQTEDKQNHGKELIKNFQNNSVKTVSLVTSLDFKVDDKVLENCFLAKNGLQNQTIFNGSVLASSKIDYDSVDTKNRLKSNIKSPKRFENKITPNEQNKSKGDGHAFKLVKSPLATQVVMSKCQIRTQTQIGSVVSNISSPVPTAQVSAFAQIPVGGNTTLQTQNKIQAIKSQAQILVEKNQMQTQKNTVQTVSCTKSVINVTKSVVPILKSKTKGISTQGNIQTEKFIQNPATLSVPKVPSPLPASAILSRKSLQKLKKQLQTFSSLHSSTKRSDQTKNLLTEDHEKNDKANILGVKTRLAYTLTIPKRITSKSNSSAYEKNEKHESKTNNDIERSSTLKPRTRKPVPKKYKVLHCLKSYIHKIADDDLILLSGPPINGYIQSVDELPRSSIQFRYVTMEEDKVTEFRKAKKIFTYGEICGMHQKTEEEKLVEDVKNFMKKIKENDALLKEFTGAIRFIITEYHKEPANSTDLVKRVSSNETYKTVKSFDPLHLSSPNHKKMDKKTKFQT